MTARSELSDRVRMDSIRALVAYYRANPTYLSRGESAWMEQVEFLLAKSDSEKPDCSPSGEEPGSLPSAKGLGHPNDTKRGEQ